MLPLLMLVLATIPDRSADTTFRISRRAVVEVSSFAQPVVVTGTSGDDLTVTGADVELNGARVSISGRMFGRGAGGPIVIRIPTSARLVVDVVNGPITITNAPDGLEVDAVNGKVEVTGGRGRMLLSATGEIAVNEFAGDRLDIEGLAGSITIRGATGRLNIESVNGPIHLERIVSREVNIESTNGQLRWIGDFDPVGRYRIESHNGGVELFVPVSLNARITLETFNGGISSAIPAAISGDPQRTGAHAERRVTATYGQGRATISISTFNGDVQVKAFNRTD